MKPTKGTPEYDLWLSAIDVAHAAPLNPGRAYSAQVPWRIITELRERLEACDIDWKTHHPQTTGSRPSRQRDRR